LRHLTADTGGSALTQSVSLQKSLEKARSPWLRFEDQSEIQLFYTLLTGETRRDKPLEVVNEPMKDNLGGGLGGCWAGTWGGNMFEDPLDGNSRSGQDGMH